MFTYKVVSKITCDKMPLCCSIVAPPQFSIQSIHVATVLQPPGTGVLHICPVGESPGRVVYPLPRPVCILVMGANPKVFLSAHAELMNKLVFFRRMNRNKITTLIFTSCFCFTPIQLCFIVLVTVGTIFYPATRTVI